MVEKNNKKEGGAKKAPLTDIEKKLQKIINKHNKEGLYSIDSPENSLEKTIPFKSGFEPFDEITGIGGMPTNCVVEIYGPEAIGKTWFGMNVLANFVKQDPDRKVIYCDLEGSANIERMKAAELTNNVVMVNSAMSAEKLFTMLGDMIVSDTISAILIDSVPALQPEQVQNSTLIGETQGYGVAIPKFMNNTLREIAPLCKKHKVLLILINQIRDNVGGGMFEAKTITPGGRAIKFYSSMRIELKKASKTIDKVAPDIIDPSNSEKIGHRVKAKIIKNRFGPPMRECVYEIYYKNADVIGIAFKAGRKAKLWKKTKGEFIYVSLDGEEIKGNTEEQLLDQMLFNNCVTEMVERIFLMQASKEIEEEILPDDFDFDLLQQKEEEIIANRENNINLFESNIDDN